MIEYALAIELNMAQIEADAKLLREHEEKYLEITLTEPPTIGDKTLFWVTQSLDIYSTYRRVEETNLFLSDRPEVEDMVALKGSIFLLVPPRTAQDYKHINLITSVAAINNFVVLDRAKKQCIKL
jgi:hypothetical protein